MGEECHKKAYKFERFFAHTQEVYKTGLEPSGLSSSYFDKSVSICGYQEDLP